VVAVRCCLVFLGPDDFDAVIAHQTANAPLPNVSLPAAATLRSSVAVRNSLGLSDAAHGYELELPYHRVDAGSSGEPATHGSHAM
jgi:hypothetical protein